MTTDFVYDGLNPAQEQSGPNVTNLLTGLGVDEYFSRGDATSTAFLLSDALGSTVALADSSGGLPTGYTYEPFGAAGTTGEPTSNPYDYTGRESDLTGLKYYRARYYHPTHQRFIGEDPLYRLARLGCSSWTAGSQRLNLYSYVENSPISFNDPLGLEKKNCLRDYFTKCLPNCAVVPGLSTAITTAGDLTADYYAAKAFVYAASRHLIYPLKSSVFRGLANIATRATPVFQLAALNYCIYYCLYEEAKCEGLF